MDTRAIKKYFHLCFQSFHKIARVAYVRKQVCRLSFVINEQASRKAGKAWNIIRQKASSFHWKQFVCKQGSAWRSFLKSFFRILENFFRSFRTKFCHLFTWYHWLRKFPRITMCNLHVLPWCYAFRTGVTPVFAPVLHFLHWYYTFCTGITLELHCSQPIRIKKFFHYIIEFCNSMPISIK